MSGGCYRMPKIEPNMKQCAKARIQMHEMGEFTKHKRLGNIFTKCLEE